MLSQMLHLFSLSNCRHDMVKISETNVEVTYQCKKCEKVKTVYQ